MLCQEYMAWECLHDMSGGMIGSLTMKWWSDNHLVYLHQLREIFIPVINQLDEQNFCFTVYFMPLHVSSTCAHHQEVKIALHSLWYHHTYRCYDTRGCVIQFWPPDDEHMCSKHVEPWNKFTVKQKFCVSSWLITEINILSCTVSKTSK